MIEYFTSNLWALWLLICIVALILELTSGDFFIMCFSIGAAITALSCVAGIPLLGQIAVWIVATVLCLIFVRPVALRYLHRGDSDRVSNADALVGKTGTVSQAIEPGNAGRVAIDGDDWKAVTTSGEPIAVGTRVRVTRLDSIVVTVVPEQQA